MSGDNAENFAICGVGASAGGLDALRPLIERVGATHAVALVIVQHLAASAASGHVSVVERMSPLPVKECSNGMVVEAGHIYVVPPQSLVGFKNGTFLLQPLAKSTDHARTIDYLFEALAEHYRERSVGIILSGNGTDGMVGLEAIAGAGGLTMVQSPETAKYAGMPSAAVIAGIADVVAAPDELAAALLDYAPRFAATSREPVRLDKQELREVCEAVREVTGHDFKHYKDSTLSRRVLRRLNVLRCASVDDYLGTLKRNADEARLLMRDLLIGVTAFFRDTEAFKALQNEVLSALINPDKKDAVRIWVAGCGSGHEAYSIAMLAHERIEACGSKQEVQVFATDLDERALSVARRGIYPATIAEEMSGERLARFFEKTGRRYQVTKALRQLVVFSPHNLISDPPFSRMDLISCRNLLIYLGPHLQKKLISVFHYALRGGGYLFLGSSESVAGHGDLFRVVDSRHRIAQRKDTAVRNAGLSRPAGHATAYAWQPLAGEASADIGAIAQRILLDEFAPPFAIANEDGQVIYLSAGAELFVQPPEGQYINNIMRMTRSGLRVGLRSAWTRAVRTRRTSTYEGVTVDSSDSRRRMRIVVQPMPELGEDAGSYMVVFHDHGTVQIEAEKGVASTADSERLVAQLEAELLNTRDELERAVQDLEAANEELKSSNEELLSMNEELQSANEELETSKEEIESGAHALAAANADLVNLLRSMDTATIFLDTQGRIRNFNPPVCELYNLTEADIGRPLSHFTHSFAALPELPNATAVTANGAAIEAEVTHTDGRTFLRRAMPYRNSEGETVGLVASFVNITAQKRMRDQLAATVAELQSIYDHAPVGLTLLDCDLRYTRINRALAEINGVPAEDHIGRTVREMVPDLADSVEPVLRKVFETGETVGPFELEGETPRQPGVKRAWIEIWAPVHDASGQVAAVSISALEITESKRAERALRDSEAAYRRALVAARSGAWSWHIAADRVEWSPEIGALLGAGPEQFPTNLAAFMAFVPQDHRDAMVAAIRGQLDGDSTSYEVENLLQRPDGTTIWVRGSGQIERDATGKAVRIEGLVTDIDTVQRARQAIVASESRLRRVLDNVVAMVGTLTPEGVLTEANQAAIKAAGLSRDDVIGKPFWDCYWWSHDAVVQQRLRVAVSNAAAGETVRYDEVIRVGDDARITIDFQLAPVFDADGKVIELIPSGFDISDRKAAEAELRRSHDTYLNLVQHAPFGVYLVDSEFRLAEISAGCERVFEGIDPLIGRDFGEILHIIWPDRFADEAIARFRHTLATGDRFRSSDTVEKRANIDAVEVYDWQLERVLLPNGQHGVVCYFYDLTAQRSAEARLAVTLERLELALDVGEMAVWDWDMRTGNVEWSDHHYRLAGYEVGEVTPSYEAWAARVHPEDLERVETAIESAKAAHETYQARFRFQHPDRAISHVIARGRFFYDAVGEPIRMLGVLDDVTLIRTSEARLQNMMATSQVGIAFSDIDGRMTEANDALLALLGRTRDDLQGGRINWNDHRFPADAEFARDALQRLVADGRAGPFERRLRADDGSEVPTLISTSLVDRRTTEHVAFVVDLSELRRVERRLAETRHDLERTYDAAPVGLAYQDRDLRFVRINRLLADFNGAPIEAHAGKTLSEIDPHLGALAEPMLRCVIDTGEPLVDFEIRVPAEQRGRDEHWWLLNYEPDKNEAGEVIGIHVAVQDITALKAAEAHRELLLGELNHRVKNSLATIQAMASNTLRHAASPEAFRTSFMGRLRAIAAAHDILTGKDRSRANLTELIAAQVGPYADMASGRVRLDGPTVMLSPATAHNLGLVLHELATNASKYGALSNASGHIDISWRLTKDADVARIRLDWAERGGPTVEAPKRKGFGSRLIEATLAQADLTSSELLYDPDGFKATLFVAVESRLAHD